MTKIISPHHSMSSADENQANVCSACGEPPRPSESGKDVLPLKRCSRCRSAWYHDQTCQKKHYANHKKECTRWAQVNTLRDSQSEDHASQRRKSSLKVRVEARPNRGNSLVATERIRQGERISPDLDGVDFWNPLVPPVLLENQRWTRCALCFGKLDSEQFQYEELDMKSNRQLFPVIFCSTECRKKGRDHGFDNEQSVVSRIAQQRGPFRIFSTAVLLYRILRICKIHHCKKTEEKFGRLQCKIPRNGTCSSSKNSSEDARHHHSQIVIATVVAMLQFSGGSAMFHSPSTELEELVNRIKINGFSIADGENIAIGIGVFSMPSFMNHSCRPNTVQTFLYGQNHCPPSLFLTARNDIRAGEEVQISYVDNSCPRHIRRRRLECDYFFHCDCDACEDTELESLIIGMRCPHCHDTKHSVQLEENVDPAPHTFRCPTCHATDFHGQLRMLRSFEEMETKSDISILERLYKNLKQHCFLGSWYVQESGDQLVHALLDKLGEAKTVQDQERFARQALKIMKELLDAYPTHSSTSREFRTSIQWFQILKLVLFLEPNPSTAIKMLEKAETMLSRFYPKHHELLNDLSISMREARMWIRIKNWTTCIYNLRTMVRSGYLYDVKAKWQTLPCTCPSQ